MHQYLEYHDGILFVQETRGHSKYTYAQLFLYIPISFVTPSALSYIQAFCIPPQQQKNMVPNFKRHSIMKTRDSYVILSTTAADDSIKCSDYQKLHNLIVGFCIYFCWK